MKPSQASYLSVEAGFKSRLDQTRLFQLAGVMSWLLCFALTARAEIIAPYTPDEHTLHLWHLNEPVTPVADAIPNGIELQALENGATLGNESYVGAKNFGTAIATYVGNPAIAPGCAGQGDYLAARPLLNSREDNVPLRYAGVGQAFTYEAVVRVDFKPAANFGAEGWGQGRSLTMQILSGDADENTDRAFQFRLAPIGTLNGNPQPLLEFINLNQGDNVQSLTAAIPTNGPEAIRAGNWYHVAVTYDGQPDRPDNLRFYWTLVQSKQTVANLIGTGQMTLNLPTGCSPDFAIGQIGRQSPDAPTLNNNFVGLIDEVRISGVARSPNEMLFGESALVKQSTTETANLAAATGTNPTAVTTEAAVDSIRRAADAVTVINGAIVRGPRSKPRVALMFSCRESDEAAITTLHTLKAQSARVSFFVSSSFLRGAVNRRLVESMVADGHYVGPQSDTWPQFAKTGSGQNPVLPAEAESHLNQLLTLGIDPKGIRYFLPTSDQLTPTVGEQARALGLTMIAGTAGTLSFAAAATERTQGFVSSQAIVDSILQIDREEKGLNGFLLLFPLDSGDRHTDRFFARFSELLTALRERGYEFVRVDELLDDTSSRKTQPSLANLREP